MEILVCVKRVPDTSENEIELNSAGNDIDRDDLVYSVNEWDNYAVEEAIQLVDAQGGSVVEDDIVAGPETEGGRRGAVERDGLAFVADELAAIFPLDHEAGVVGRDRQEHVRVPQRQARSHRP